jgi:nitrate reductase gamma subunit
MMYPIYQFVTGPLAWISFAIFFIGVIVRTVFYIRGLDWQLDRVSYSVNTGYGIKGALRSVFFWLIPFGTRSWQVKPGFTLMFFVFHIGLLVTPVFLQAHNILLRERWGFSLWSISDSTADILTILMLVAAVFLILRRIALPEVRILTDASDYLVLTIAVAPFITGFLASQHAPGYDFWLILHIVSGEVMLAAIPFTKLSHFVLFFLSRAQLGMDFGIKRGGMKGKGLAW